MHGDVLPKRTEQIIEELRRQGTRSDGIPKRSKDGILNRLTAQRLAEPTLPGVQEPETFGWSAPRFVSEVVCRAGERIHSGDVWTHRRWHEPGRNREILVMTARDIGAMCVGALE